MDSSSKRPKKATNVGIQNPEEVMKLFLLPELTLLIKILRCVTAEDLISEDIFIKIVNDYISKIGFDMRRQPLTQQKIETVNANLNTN